MLTPAQIDDFIAHGCIKVAGAIDPAFCAERVRLGWERSGYDPADRSTWEQDRLHLSSKVFWKVGEIAPLALEAIGQLCGGHERIAEPIWSDAFIINFRVDADKPWQDPSPAAKGWHKDGDFFHHFLDSPEQALLTVVIWQDVATRGGATFIARDSVAPIARHLAAHPEGVDPYLFPSKDLITECADFAEAEGRAGDVWLLHPYLLHATSPNHSGRARFITNPPVHFREPMRFDPPASPVEAAICRGLGVDRYSFTPTAPRKAVTPHRKADQAALDAAELARRLAKQAPR